VADNALTPAVVDIPFWSLNQTPPDHAGPTGRLVQLYDSIVTHYDASGQKKILIDPRQGFVSLSNVLRNARTGATESDTWASPEFLFALGDQLLSICSSRPRVWNGFDWTNYGGTADSVYPSSRVVTQRLSESVLHTANDTIAAPDHAWLGGVTCSVWVEQESNAKGVPTTTSAWVGFRADDGAWVRVPSQLRTANATTPDFVVAKVVTDGSNFWVVYNTGPPEVALFTANCYDIHGVLLATRSDITRFWIAAPGYWDLYGSNIAGVLLAQPAAYNAVATDVHVNVKKLALSGSTITVTNSALSSAHCMGPVSWLTNDLSGNFVYLATVGIPLAGAHGRLWAYEINSSTLAQTHEYDVNEFPELLPDSMTGWVEDVAGSRKVNISYSVLARLRSDGGPPYDPQTRYTRTVFCTRTDFADVTRQTNGVIQQSRAFAIDGEYHAYTYFQSGSGQALPGAAETVPVSGGDYFIGDKVQPLTFTGGGTDGPPFSPRVAGIFTGLAGFTGKLITGTDTVALTDSTTAGLAGLPANTPVLKWTFANATPTISRDGDILKVNSSSIPSANFQWDIYTGSGAGIWYTATTNRLGGTVVPGTFTATGTVDVIQVARYTLPALSTDIPPDVMGLFVPGGTITIAGASNPANNGTFTLIKRDSLLTGLDNLPLSSLAPAGGSLWCVLTTQVSDGSFSGTATVSASNPYFWFFGGELFTDADLNSFLTITDNPVTENNADHLDVITASASTSLEVDHAQAAATVAQIFSSPPPFPTVSLNLKDDSKALTFVFSAETFDYTYQGASLSITGAQHPSVNGIYKITQVIDAQTIRVVSTSGATGQRSETFGGDFSLPTVVIQRGTNVQPQTQPTWFVTPLTGSQPQVGCFEAGLAYADWRFDGATDEAPDLGPQDWYRFCLSSTSAPFGTIRQVVLPFRATSFTQVSIATVGATPIDIANTAEASTVGLKIFRSQGTGEGVGDAGKLLIPGLLAAEFTRSGFAESNFNVGPEAPWVVIEETDATTHFALTPGQTYTYQLIVTTTLENGDVVQSKPSPAIQVTMTGTNNVVTLGGRVLAPLTTAGAPVANTYGVTNHRNTTYAISRSTVVNGVPSTQLHLITNPGAPNAIFNGTPPGSGFTFPDQFTWNYRDSNPDAGVQTTEVIYAGTLGQGIAPHFPCPPFRHATTWANRRWVVGYDGAVWMSAELQDGEDTWFFPGFRYPFPEEDPAVCVVGFENFLFMFCAKSIWRIGITELPNATLTSGSMPPPVKLPWAMGCSGYAVAMSDVVAYSSSVDGGQQVWAITRNLANVYLSEPISDTFTDNNLVSGMAVDGKQRLLVLANDTNVRVYDPIPREWYVWRMPTVPNLIASYQGQPTYQDGAFVVQQSDSQFVDTYNGFVTDVMIDLTLSSLTFAQVRAVKRLWEAQIIGEGHGACNINAVISYPFSTEPPTTFGPSLVNGVGDLLLAINPAVEDAGEFVIRIFGSVEGIGLPGRCFSLEMLSCEVGLDSRQGLRKLPDGFRLVGT